MSEIKIHQSLKHENIVNFEHFFEDSENVYILLELCQNQTLNELLRRRQRLTELEVKYYLLQILRALQYIHSNQIIHRDLKLSNLFLTNKMEIKVGDFGLATKINFISEKKRTVCGTPNYIAPEILESKLGHSYEADIWSLGVVLYILLIGKPPFETSDVKRTYKKIRMNCYKFPENILISREARDLIEKILVTEPIKRLTLQEICLHDFLNTKYTIPKMLPNSTLACPPSLSFLKKFMPNNDLSIVLAEKTRIDAENTEPLIIISENKCLKSLDFRTFDRRASENPNTFIFKKFSKNNSKMDIFLEKDFKSNDYGAKNKASIEIEAKENFNCLKNEKGINNKNKISSLSENILKNDVYLDHFLDYSLKYGLGRFNLKQIFVF